jgi:hypothetical protein
MNRHSFLPVMSTLLLAITLSASGQQQGDNTVRLSDDSDWWSINRGPDSDGDAPTRKGELEAGTLQILGISPDENMFDRAAAKLGKAAVIARGDASTGRQQVCYRSAGTPANVYLVFEKGEVGFTFYLFTGGPTWEGADRCVESKAISNGLATASGLHLGMTPSQLVAILGQPTKRDKGQLVYSFLTRKKTSPDDLKEARERNPDMDEKDFHANYDYYDLGTGVEARFKNSKLIYLAVSKVESN